MFIEDIVDLVNRFARMDIRDFKVECHDGYLWIYTSPAHIFKTRDGKKIEPISVPVPGHDCLTEVNLESTDFLADGQVYHTSYTYNHEKEYIRNIVSEEVDKYMKERIKDVRIVIK